MVEVVNRPRCFGAFNFSNFEALKGILRAAKSGAPLIVQISQRSLQSLLEGEMELGEVVGRVRPLPLNLDHASDFGLIGRCLEGGFDSVHVKGEIGLTKRVVRLAHSQGQALRKIVEGEVGKAAPDPKSWTDPEEAANFVQKTGVDRLAVAVGNVHGITEKPDQLDLDLLKRIHRAVDVPLVLHGGSFIRREDIRRAIKLGVEKINFNTELKLAYDKNGAAGVQEVVEEKIEWLHG